MRACKHKRIGKAHATMEPSPRLMRGYDVVTVQKGSNSAVIYARDYLGHLTVLEIHRDDLDKLLLDLKSVKEQLTNV